MLSRSTVFFRKTKFKFTAKKEADAWDVKQTFRSIAPFTIEEAYEVADAIERGDMIDLKDELGDLLFQVVFHAQMASETKASPSCFR